MWSNLDFDSLINDFKDEEDKDIENLVKDIEKEIYKMIKNDSCKEGCLQPSKREYRDKIIKRFEQHKFLDLSICKIPKDRKDVSDSIDAWDDDWPHDTFFYWKLK